MKINDRVYGEVEITEPVLLEIIEGRTMQRLKDIMQYGYMRAQFPEAILTRFEHSVGVCLLLKRYNASIEEKIAGLIHDVSHSAFSHCIDYVLDEGSEKTHNHQDNIFDDFVKNSEIPKILEKHGFDVDFILDDGNFPLKEKELPDLCADRIDYTLRDGSTYGYLNKENADYILSNLLAEDNVWVFNDFDSAKKYAELARGLNNERYAGLPSAIMHRTVGDYLKHALQMGYISKEDLYTTDNAVLLKISKYHSGDERLQLLFDRMNMKKKCENNKEDFDVEVFNKSRIVDPLFKTEVGMQRISDVDPAWPQILKEESKPKHFFLKFER